MINELYDRLAKTGFSKADIRKYALPDWWCDEYEQENPVNATTTLAMYVSRFTNISVWSILTQGKALTFTSNSHTRTQIVMRDRYAAGETVEDLMLDYDLDKRVVERMLGIN